MATRDGGSAPPNGQCLDIPEIIFKTSKQKTLLEDYYPFYLIHPLSLFLHSYIHLKEKASLGYEEAIKISRYPVMLIFTVVLFGIAYLHCILLISIIAALPSSDLKLIYKFVCFPKFDIAIYSEDLFKWIFFKFSFLKTWKKLSIFWVYCTALLLTSPMIGKASRRLHFICVLLKEQTSCHPNLCKYKYALSARFPYFNQRHTLRSWVKYNWRPIAFGLTLNGKIFNFIIKICFLPIFPVSR